jgi:hypothetical protein
MSQACVRSSIGTIRSQEGSYDVVTKIPSAWSPRNNSPPFVPAPAFAGGELQRGPRVTDCGPWIPSTSAFTRVFDALCAGMNGRNANDSPLVAAISVRSLSRLRGRVGEGVASTNLVVCPLPVPPAEVGFIRLRPVHTWPNSGKPEFGCKRGRGRRSRMSLVAGCREGRTHTAERANSTPSRAFLWGRSQRGRDPC